MEIPMKTTTTFLLTAITLFVALPAAADSHSSKMPMMSSGLFCAPDRRD
jgi:hypothetical protein